MSTSASSPDIEGAVHKGGQPGGSGVKDRLKRLPFAIERALQERALREQQHAAEKALREGEDRFRRLVQISPETILVGCGDQVVGKSWLECLERADGNIALLLLRRLPFRHRTRARETAR